MDGSCNGVIISTGSSMLESSNNDSMAFASMTDMSHLGGKNDERSKGGSSLSAIKPGQRSNRPSWPIGTNYQPNYNGFTTSSYMIAGGRKFPRDILDIKMEKPKGGGGGDSSSACFLLPSPSSSSKDFERSSFRSSGIIDDVVAEEDETQMDKQSLDKTKEGSSDVQDVEPPMSNVVLKRKTSSFSENSLKGSESSEVEWL